MKKIISILMLGLCCALNSMGQIVPDTSHPSGPEFKMSLDNSSSEFNYGQYGPSSTQKAYLPKCSGLRNVDFKISFPHPDAGRPIKVSFEIYKRGFNPADGTTSPSGAKIFTSSDEILITSVDIINYFPPRMVAEPNAYYFAVVKYKKLIEPGFWSVFWSEYATNNMNFLGGGASTTAAGTLNTGSAVLMGSSTGDVVVELFDPANDVILNATPTSCEDRYGIEIEEFNLSDWTGVPGTNYNSGAILGDAPSINLSDLYPSPFRHAVYRVVLYAGPEWSSVQYFMKPKSKTGKFAGEQEAGEAMNVHMYPNPSSGIITLSSQYDGNVFYEIVDQLGRNISKDKLTARENRQLDLSVHAKGMYLLRLSYDGKVQTRKLILQ